MKQDQMRKKPDVLGDKLKGYEAAAESRAMKGIPLLVRLDGRAFHTFTRGLNRPYDERMSSAMIHTAKYLVEQTNAIVGYTQSDEISCLYFVEEDSLTDYIFSGRTQKIASSLAAMASVKFNQIIDRMMPEKALELPTFDCRVFQVPTKELAADAFKWRELDATKNAVSMAAHAYFPHKALEGLKGWQKQELLFSTYGINFNDYPVFFKRGTYVRRVERLVSLDADTLAKIPVKNRPDPDQQYKRSVVEEVEYEICTKYSREEWAKIIFEGKA